MSDQDSNPNKYSKLRSIYKYYIDSYDALYQLKTEKEEDLNSIYKMIKMNLIDSKKRLPQIIIKDILDIIPYNNRCTKSYLYLAKLISDDYQIKDVSNVELVSNFLFYKEYSIKLDKSANFNKFKSENLDILKENTIYRAIMNNDLEVFIAFTEREAFAENQKLKSSLYPYSEERFILLAPCSYYELSLLELCCYYGAVDCFKFLRTKFNSEITKRCLTFSFLGRNQEIMSECLKQQKPDQKCMKYAIISHNIDFVTFLVNEHIISIDLSACGKYNNLDSFLVFYDQTNLLVSCLVFSPMFNIPSLCEYFLSLGVNINKKLSDGKTALHIAALHNSKEIAELLISHGININEKDKDGETALHIAAEYNSKEIVELLISHGVNINEKDKNGETALRKVALNTSKETIELLISHGAYINEKDTYEETALRFELKHNSKETAEVLKA